jgi:hypothetical protein
MVTIPEFRKNSARIDPRSGLVSPQALQSLESRSDNDRAFDLSDPRAMRDDISTQLSDRSYEMASL